MSDPNIAPPALAAWTVPGISDDAPHVRLEALPGQVTCLVGANGAGKGGQLLNARNVHNGASYPSFQMSDGEKSAMLLTADVLTAPAGVLIIDEPERHLRRAISAGLIEAVVDERPDCHFIVLTHDLDLIARLADHPGDTYAVTGVRWVGDLAQGWDFTLVDEEGTSDAARTAILGGRSRIVFIEGRPTSPNLPRTERSTPASPCNPPGAPTKSSARSEVCETAAGTTGCMLGASSTAMLEPRGSRTASPTEACSLLASARSRTSTTSTAS